MTSKESLLNHLRDYLNNPKQVEEEFLKNAVNPMTDVGYGDIGQLRIESRQPKEHPSATQAPRR